MTVEERDLGARARLSAPAFVQGLRGQGERLAVVTPDAQLSYRQLADRVEQTAAAIGTGRRLVLVEAANDLGTLVGYLAALHGGHVALLAPRGDEVQIASLTERFDPEVVVGADGGSGRGGRQAATCTRTSPC